MDENALLKVGEVAAWLRVKSSWVYRHADELGGYRLGKYLRFSRARVLEKLAHAASAGSLIEPSIHAAKANLAGQTFNGRAYRGENI